MIDTSDLGNGNVTTTNINEGNVLGLNEPFAIVIATPSVGPNMGKTIALHRKPRFQTITSVDTATNKVVGTPIRCYLRPHPLVNVYHICQLTIQLPHSIGIATSDGVYANTKFGGALAIQLTNNKIIDNGEFDLVYAKTDKVPWRWQPPQTDQ